MTNNYDLWVALKIYMLEIALLPFAMTDIVIARNIVAKQSNFRACLNCEKIFLKL